MKNDDKTGWFERDGIWYLCYKGADIANFCLSENLDPIQIMYDSILTNEYAQWINHPSGDINEAKSMIENKIISHCSEQIDTWMNIRYSVIRTAGERMNNNG